MDATVTVTERTDVGPDTITVEFTSPDGFEAAPGQFVKLTATVEDESYSRFYTLSSADVVGSFEVTIGIDPDEGGPFSAYLSALAPGDEIEMSGPFGSAYYEGESRVVVLAGGPGIGPAVGIGERVLEDGGELAIIYQDETPAHSERLDALAVAGASVTVTDGSLTDAVAENVTGASTEQVFIYGFADFLSAAADALSEAGVDPENAKTENFG